MIKTINIFSLYITRSQNSTGAIWEEIIEHFDELKNIKVRVFTTKRSKSLSNFNEILAVSGYSGDKTNINKIMQNISYSISFLYSLLRLERGSTVFLGTNPPTLLIAAALAKKIRRHKFILLSHDIYPNNLIAGNILKSKKSMAYRFLEYIFKKSYSSADRVFAIGRDMKEVLSESVAPERIKFIPCWISEHEKIEKSIHHRSTKLTATIPSKLTFTYFGNIGRLQDVENIVLSTGFLPRPNNIQIDIFGSGPSRDDLVELIHKLNPDNLRYLGECKPSEKWAALQHGDAALITLKAGMYGLGVPSKLYYSILSKQPILYVGDDKSEVARVIREFNLGLVVPPASPQLLALAFQEFQDRYVTICNNAGFDSAIDRYYQGKVLNEMSLVF